MKTYKWMLTTAALLSAACGRAADERSSDLAPCDPQVPSASRIVDRTDVRARLGRTEFPDAKVDILPSADVPPGKRVLALSWGGPDAGAVLVTSCNGTLLAAKQVGYVDSIASISLGSNVPRLLAVFGHSAGVTDYASQGMALYWIRPDSVRLVWSGLSFESSQTRGSEYEEKAQIRLDSGVISRQVTERRQSHKLSPTLPPAELFRWDSVTSLFLKANGD